VNVPQDIKVIIDRKINTAIVEAMGMIPEAITLAQGLATVTTYEEYQQYLSKLNVYHVVTNGIGDYISTAQRVIRKSSEEHITTQYNSHIEELTRHIIGATARKGIVCLDQPIPFEAVLQYAQNIWSQHQKLVFVQPNNVSITGKITADAWRGKKKLPVLRGWSSEGEEGLVFQTTFYTQRMLDRKTWDEDSVLTQEVFGYRLWDNQNFREYLILSETPIKQDEKSGVFSGFLVEKSENVLIGDDLKIGAFANILHINNIRPEVQGIFEVHKYPWGVGPEVVDVRNVRVNTESDISKAIENAIFNKYKHPKWFMNLIYYYLLSSPSYEYPLHIFIFQDGSGGKSTLLRLIASTMGIRHADIWSGNKSTLKSLVPSFGCSPPQIGWMSLQQNIGLLDEFFGRQSSHDSTDKLYEYDSIKDMLDGNQSDSLSAKGIININATAKFLFSSNLKYGIRDLETFMNRTDAALVERMLVYFMNKEHEQFIKDNREAVSRLPDEVEPHEGSRNFVKHLIIHAQSFKIYGIDYDRLKAIREKLGASNTLDMTKTMAVDNYIDARMSHHLICLLDGIVKFRYFTNKIYTGEMTPIEDDYKELEQIAEIISHSWMNEFNIRDFSLDARVRLLSGHARELYHFVREQGGLAQENDYVVYANEVLKLDPKVSGHATNTLLSWGVLVQEQGYFKCYWRTAPPKQEKPDPLKPVPLKEPMDGVCGSCGERKWLEFSVGGNSYCRGCANND
jgi:hypothetical protein